MTATSGRFKITLCQKTEIRVKTSVFGRDPLDIQPLDVGALFLPRTPPAQAAVTVTSRLNVVSTPFAPGAAHYTSLTGMAEALRKWCKQAGYGLEMQNEWAELKIRAEREAGEILREAPRGIAGRNGKDSKKFENEFREETYLITFQKTLKENDISKKRAYELQLITRHNLPDEIFEQYIAEVKSNCQELTSIGVIEKAKEINYKTAQRWQLIVTSRLNVVSTPFAPGAAHYTSLTVVPA